MAALIGLTDEQVAEATHLATATYERWQHARGHYRNTLSSHRKGKLGEVAVETWGIQNGLHIEPWFRDTARERDADIGLDDQRLDVKTWDIRYWESMGRCVRPDQIAALARKADGIVWCFVNESTQEVTIAGWSTVAEVARLPTVLTGPVGRELENHQMPVDLCAPLNS